MWSRPDQAGNRSNRAACAEQEQGVDATTDARIGPGQQARRLLLRAWFDRHGDVL
jgi:hypothetical protein